MDTTRVRSSPPSRRLRVGVIGAGAWARQSYLPLLAGRPDEVELWAVARRDPTALRDVQKRHGFRYAFADYRDLVGSGVDVCLISSPGALHAEHARTALMAGCHVLVEKPFTVASADAWQLSRLAAASQRHLVVSYGFNYLPIALEAQALMAGSPGIGQVEFLSVHMGTALRGLLDGTASGDTGARHHGWQPATYADWAVSGGGYAQAQLTHALGLALWLTGLRASSVFACTSPADSRIERHEAMTVSFTGGAIGTIGGTSTHVGGGRRRQQLTIRATGTDGELLLDIESNTLRAVAKDGSQTLPLLASDAGQYVGDGPLSTLLDLALHRPGVNRSPGELGARVVELIEAGYRSRDCDGPVRIATDDDGTAIP